MTDTEAFVVALIAIAMFGSGLVIGLRTQNSVWEKNALAGKIVVRTNQTAYVTFEK